MFSGNRSLASNLCRALFVTCALTALCFLAPALSSAAQVTLAWDPNTEADLAGYRLYYGLSNRNYSSVTDVGNFATNTVPGLAEGTTYFFAVTAYNTSGLESDFSNEINYTTPLSALSAQTNQP